MNKLGQFFQEDNGNYSATRLAFLAWIFGALIIWSIGSLHNQKMQDIPDSVQVLLGVLMTGKVAQKFREEKPSLDPTNEATLEGINQDMAAPDGKPSMGVPANRN